MAGFSEIESDLGGFFDRIIEDDDGNVFLIGRHVDMDVAVARCRDSDSAFDSRIDHHLEIARRIAGEIDTSLPDVNPVFGSVNLNM